jgi:hypothetical protein
VHERWPSYWAALFEKQGFLCFDVLRSDLWYDERVEWWYRQNMLVFVRNTRTELVAKLQASLSARRGPIDLVHPLCFAAYRGTAELINTGQAVVASLPHAEIATLSARIEAIQQSTSWSIISAVQRRLYPYPTLRTFIRRGVKVAWWTISLQLRAKLRERKAKRRGTRIES